MPTVTHKLTPSLRISIFGLALSAVLPVPVYAAPLPDVQPEPQLPATPVRDADQGVQITSITVKRFNIFEGQQNKSQAFQLAAAGINRVHKTTHEAVILKEADVAVGDTITAVDVEDIERRLRKLGIFASVSAQLTTVDDGVDLQITTRDNFSIVAGASGSYLGGVGNVGFTTGERNLLGTGNSLLFGLSGSTTDDFKGSLAFNDLHFLDSNWSARYRLGRTNDGEFYGFRISDPFGNARDDTSYVVNLDKRQRDRTYSRDGVEAFAVPEDNLTLTAIGIKRFDPKPGGLRYKTGAEARVSQLEYGAPSGVLVGEISTPDDYTQGYIGGMWGFEKSDGFSKRKGLDTLDYVQDLGLGTVVEFRIGTRITDEQDTGNTYNDTVVSTELSKATKAGDNILLSFQLKANGVYEEGGAKPWGSRATVKAYYTGIESNTIAMRVEHSNGEDGRGLPTELTLGGSNGLRGYDSSQFEGRQRVRMNFESRYRGFQIGPLDVGLVGFFDAGWAGARDESKPEWSRSTGVGLRLASTVRCTRRRQL